LTEKELDKYSNYIVCVDKAQKDGKHEVKHQDIARLNKLQFVPLPYGDYCLATSEILQTINRRGNNLKKIDLVGKIKISVDTKQHMQELYQDIISDHGRFRDECILANDNGCKLYILVENDDGIKQLSDVCKWQNPRITRYYYFKKLKEQGKAQNVKLGKRAPVSSKDLQTKLETMQEKYGVEFLFCTKQECGSKIMELLTNQIKEEMEN